MMKNKYFNIIFLIVIIISSNQVIISNAINQDQLVTELHQTWKRLSYIDINDDGLLPIIVSLNKCIELINIGGDENLTNAENELKDVNAKLTVLKNYREQLRVNEYISVGIILTIFVTISILIWVKGSKIYWTFWFNVRKKWRVNFD